MIFIVDEMDQPGSSPPPASVEPLAEESDDNEEEEEELTADEVVQSTSFSFVTTDGRELDIAEEAIIQHFSKNGCACNLRPNKSPCCQGITFEHYRSLRCQMSELTNDELDLVVIGQVMAGSFQASTFRNIDRSRSYTMFLHCGETICQKTFLFFHTIGYSRFKAIKASYMVMGIEPTVHKSKGKHRQSGSSVNDFRGVVNFIMNYAGKYVCPLKV